MTTVARFVEILKISGMGRLAPLKLRSLARQIVVCKPLRRVAIICVLSGMVVIYIVSLKFYPESPYLKVESRSVA